MSRNNMHTDNSMIWTGTGEEISRRKVGGKAYNLGHLNTVPEISVPRWICLTTDFFYEFLGERRAKYEDLLEHYHEGSREEILDLLGQCCFSETQRELLRDVMKQELAGTEKVAVRSSAVDEDAADQSFASSDENFFQWEAASSA